MRKNYFIFHQNRITSPDCRFAYARNCVPFNEENAGIGNITCRGVAGYAQRSSALDPYENQKSEIKNRK